jgi:hypothetical protein
MISKLKFSNKKSFIYLFIPLIPLFEIYIKNFYIIDSAEKKYLFYFSLTTFIFFSLVLFFSKNNELIVSSLSLFYLVCFNYKNVTDFAVDNAPPAISKLPNYAFFIWLLVLLFLLAFNLFFLRRDIFKNFLIVFLIVSVFNSLNVLYGSRSDSTVNSTSNQSDEYTNLDKIKLVKKPNIYFIVFDGMANLETAKKYYNFDSDMTQKFLIQSDFSINQYSTSPYGQSLPTMGSILNLDYLFDQKNIPFSTRSKILEPYLNTQSIVYDIFTENDYEIFLMGKIFPCDKDSIEVYCIESSGYKSTSYNILINTPLAIIVNNRSSFENIYNLVSQIFNFGCSPDCSEKNFDTISKEIEILDNPEKPNLIFLHYMYTHEPFTVNSDCSDREIIFYEYPIYNQEAYRDSINCSLNQIKDLEINITDSDIVIAMSDHGPFYFSKIDYISELTKEDIDNRYKTFLAYKINEKYNCGTDNNFQSVNIFRILINCLSNENLDILEIKSYFMSYGTQKGTINYGNEKVELIDVKFSE